MVRSQRNYRAASQDQSQWPEYHELWLAVPSAAASEEHNKKKYSQEPERRTFLHFQGNSSLNQPRQPSEAKRRNAQGSDNQKGTKIVQPLAFMQTEARMPSNVTSRSQILKQGARNLRTIQYAKCFENASRDKILCRNVKLRCTLTRIQISKIAIETPTDVIDLEFLIEETRRRKRAMNIK